MLTDTKMINLYHRLQCSVKIADVLEVTVDYLLSKGTDANRPVTAEFRVLELLECFLEADKLNDDDREVVKKMVHAFVVKNTVDNLARKK